MDYILGIFLREIIYDVLGNIVEWMSFVLFFILVLFNLFFNKYLLDIVFYF